MASSSGQAAIKPGQRYLGGGGARTQRHFVQPCRGARSAPADSYRLFLGVTTRSDSTTSYQLRSSSALARTEGVASGWKWRNVPRSAVATGAPSKYTRSLSMAKKLSSTTKDSVSLSVTG